MIGHHFVSLVTHNRINKIKTITSAWWKGCALSFHTEFLFIWIYELLKTMCFSHYWGHASALRYKHWLKGLSLLMPKVSHFHLVWKVMAFRIRKTKTWGPSLSSMALGTVNLWLFLYGLKYSLHKKYMYLKRNNSLPCLKWYLTSLIYVIKE